MHRAYTAIFTRLGLKFRSVKADTGAIGGSGSEEFHVLAESGEDAIVFSDGDSYAANIELAVAAAARGAARRRHRERWRKWPLPTPAPSKKSPRFLKVPADQVVKTLLVDGADGGVVALVVRGDHELNAVKAQKLPGVANPLRMASGAAIAAGHRRRGRLTSDPWDSRARCTPITRPWRWPTSSAARTRRMRT